MKKHGSLLLLSLFVLFPTFVVGQQTKKPAPRTADGKIDLSGFWRSAGGVPGQRNDPPPYQPWAQANHDDIRKRNNVDDPMGKCLLVGVPRITTMPMPFKIIQLPKEVVIVYEAFHGIRIIPT